MSIALELTIIVDNILNDWSAPLLPSTLSDDRNQSEIKYGETHRRKNTRPRGKAREKAKDVGGCRGSASVSSKQSEIKYGETLRGHRSIDKDVDVSRGAPYRDCEEDGR
tara:strand:+ start:576 stop:902 length:327 start_codon:yes stop_codon:yes gene_type:complete